MDNYGGGAGIDCDRFVCLLVYNPTIKMFLVEDRPEHWKPYGGQTRVLGGHVEDTDENIKAAAYREMMNGMGIAPSDLSHVCKCVDYDNNNGTGKLHLFDYFCFTEGKGHTESRIQNPQRKKLYYSKRGGEKIHPLDRWAMGVFLDSLQDI